MPEASHPQRTQRQARLQWVPIALMRVSPLAQRELNNARVDRLITEFDPEQIGTPTVNKRDGHFYVIDGQHRVEAMKGVGWGDQQVQCWSYEALTEVEEAETFLRLNDTLAVHGFAKFRVSVQAGRADECDIDRIVRAQGLVVSQNKTPGAISAVGTLIRVYRRSDGATLGRALRIIRDAYGDSGFEAHVIDGVGLVCQRYDTLIDEDAVAKLRDAHGGVAGMVGKAEVIRRSTGNQRGHCVAAACVEIMNSRRGGRKLASWWANDSALQVVA